MGGNWDLKRWPKENFKELVARLKDENIKIVVPGGTQDREMAQAMVDQNSRVVTLAGQTNLKQLIALLKRARLVVSADSGPLHIANTVGTHTLGIFGPTRPEVTGPRGKGKSIILQKDVGCNRAPCYFLECPDNVCMKAVTVEEVYNAIKKLI
jgi:ADP-heptose:LPS heptosyltransferase